MEEMNLQWPRLDGTDTSSAGNLRMRLRDWQCHHSSWRRRKPRKPGTGLKMQHTDLYMIRTPRQSTWGHGEQLTRHINQESTLPGPMPHMEKAILAARIEPWKQVSNDYVKENSCEGGIPKVSNLNVTERIGLNKLIKKIRAKEISVMEADEGNVFTVIIDGQLWTPEECSYQPGQETGEG